MTDKKQGKKFAPWEKPFKKIFDPIEEFVHDEASGGLLLMACAVLAMVMANTGLATIYEGILHTRLTVNLGEYAVSHSVHHWINDGLMALFFFVVGLEIKREVLVGELADFRQAALPIAAAIGGVVVPALLFFILNRSGDAANGWAIPMATDIAFAMGVLILLGNRVPKALLGLLLAVAIVDDLIAVLVIAFFYTSSIAWGALMLVGVFFFLLFCCNFIGLRSPIPYFVVGTFLWLAMMESGVHATLAGVLTAMMVPARSKCQAPMFSHHMHDLMARFDKVHEPGKGIMENNEQQAVLRGLENGVRMMETPLQRLEHGLHLWVAFLVLPVFALANAGIPIELSTLPETLTHPVTIGIILGLVGGKLIGIMLACWLVVKSGISRLPTDVTFNHIVGLSLLAGIGFTMSIFIGELAYSSQETYLLYAKTGVILASLLAGSLGYAWLYIAGKKNA
ncbi:MAG: Na+/H+ antiporter NhaA [Thermodesulfobacteriota bacterium]|nr:Na+/H+ antiporter NhaA [Thermodesulfobacteriota bacterium]